MTARKTFRRMVLLFLFTSVLAGCLAPTPQPTPEPSQTPSPTAADTPTPSLAPTRTATPSPTFDPLRPWGSFPGPAPRQTPVTPIPSPAPALAYPDEVQALVLLGSDSRSPYVSRTDAIQLILYHPRLGRASLVSLPPDLMVYIPGYTMQRLQVAYAVGGWFGLADTLQYNLGIRPSHYVLVFTDQFTRFIDRDLDGLDVTSLRVYPDPKICGGIPAGTFHMTGSEVLCYISFREGPDEVDRNRRQQEVFRQILLRMVQSGNLARLPQLVQDFRGSIETDLQLAELVDAIPLALKLGDSRRIQFYHLNLEDLAAWKIPGDLPAGVFLPGMNAIRPVLQEALNFIQTPAPVGDVVKTYAAALTNVPTSTRTVLVSITPTPNRTLTATPTSLRSGTPGGTPTRTRTPGGPTPTPSPTQPGYSGPPTATRMTSTPTATGYPPP